MAVTTTTVPHGMGPRGLGVVCGDDDDDDEVVGNGVWRIPFDAHRGAATWPNAVVVVSCGVSTTRPLSVPKWWLWEESWRSDQVDATEWYAVGCASK